MKLVVPITMQKLKFAVTHVLFIILKKTHTHTTWIVYLNKHLGKLWEKKLEHFNYILTFLIESSEYLFMDLWALFSIVSVFQSRNNGIDPVCTSFRLHHSSLYTFKEISLKIGLKIHTPCKTKFWWPYWKVLPIKNLVSAFCVDFSCRGCCSESQHFGEWYHLSGKELWPITYKRCSFILDVLMSKSNFFSLKNSLNAFTKFPKVGIFHVMWIKNVRLILTCQLPHICGEIFEASWKLWIILVNWGPEVAKGLVHDV